MRELPLIGDIPSPHVGGLGIERHIDVSARRREEKIPVLGKWISTRVAAPRIGERGRPDVDIVAVRRVGGFAFIEPGFGRVV